MKSFIVFAVCFAVASANLINPVAVTDEVAEIQQIIAAINHPSTNPATAAALEEMLNELLGIKPEPEYEPISVEPVIIDGEYEPISVGPAIIEPPTMIDSPVSSPLVQIIINVNSGSPAIAEEPTPSPVIVVPQPIDVDPVIVPEPIIVSPVIVPDLPSEPIVIEPVVVPEPIVVSPVIVPDVPANPDPIVIAPVVVPEPIVVEPVIIPEVSVIPEPIVVAPVIIPEAVVNLPGILN